MHTLKQNRVIILLLILNLAVAVLYFGGWFISGWKANQIPASTATSTEEFVEKQERRGIQSKADFYEGQAVLNNVVKSGTLSAKDEQWIVKQLHDQETRKRSGNLLNAEIVVGEIKTLSSTQKTRLFEVCGSVVVSSGVGPAPSWRREIACDLLAKIGDRRGVPLLLPLLEGQPNRTQRKARKALQELGYTAKAKG